LTAEVLGRLVQYISTKGPTNREVGAKVCGLSLWTAFDAMVLETCLKYFHNHVNPPETPQTVLNAGMWFLLRPDVVFVILGIFIIWCAYH
jgi:hypothetical protein